MEPSTIKDIVRDILVNQETLSRGIKKRDSLEYSQALVSRWEQEYRKHHGGLPYWYDAEMWWNTCFLLSEELDAKKDVGEV